MEEVPYLSCDLCGRKKLMKRTATTKPIEAPNMKAGIPPVVIRDKIPPKMVPKIRMMPLTFNVSLFST